MENNLSLEQLPKAVLQLFERLNTIEKLILSQSSNQDTDQLLTVNQASEILHLSVPTLYGLCQNKQIPFCKKGKRLYFSKLELNSWIMQGRKKTVAEIQAEIESSSVRKGGA